MFSSLARRRQAPERPVLAAPASATVISPANLDTSTLPPDRPGHHRSTLVGDNSSEEHAGHQGVTEEAGMGREQEPGGDYGYDLVHEEVQAGRPEGNSGELTPASSPEDRSGDYGYDEAHDF